MRTQEHCNSLANNMQNQIEESSKFTISSLSSSREANNNMIKEIAANATASTHAIVTQAFGMLSDRADNLEVRIITAEGSNKLQTPLPFGATHFSPSISAVASDCADRDDEDDGGWWSDRAGNIDTRIAIIEGANTEQYIMPLPTRAIQFSPSNSASSSEKAYENDDDDEEPFFQADDCKDQTCT